MTRFRPCIDLHRGRVKQIVGGTLRDNDVGLRTNFESEHPAAFYADLYRRDGLGGGHLIKLGPGNDEAAKEALAAYPGGLQVGGGVGRGNAAAWLEAGASHVIVTSWLFDAEGWFRSDRLEDLVREIGRDRIVVDLSCRADESGWVVAMDRWQTKTNLRIDGRNIVRLAESCAEFLVHAADREGRCEGVDEELVAFLGNCSPVPVTYAGGVQSFDDLQRVRELSGGKVDVSVGSALDLFGGNSVRYRDCVEWNRRMAEG